MGIKIVLENAKAQLEAQKAKTFNEAKAQIASQLKRDSDAYVAQKKAEYDEAVKTLTDAYNAAINERRTADDTAATTYANSQVEAINASIAKLQAIIDEQNEV